MDVPMREVREPLKTTLFKGEMQVGQDGPSCSYFFAARAPLLQFSCGATK